MGRLIWTVALAFAAAQATAADRAVPRDSGGGGSDRSSSSSAADRHPSSSASSSSSSHGSSGSSGSSYSSGSRSHATPRTDAQRRQPRPGTGTGDRWYGGRSGRYYGDRYRYGGWGYYWDYGFYDPYYWSWGYSPFYYGGYYGYSPSYYRRYRTYRDSGAMRVMVEPEKTRVYVDGYYAGVADDFDGLFQRLYLPPGRHDLTLKLEGYRTQHFKVYVPVDGTVKLHYDMVRGDGEATSEQYIGEPADYARIEEGDRDRDDDEAWERRDDRYGRDDRYRRDDRDRRDAGLVRLDVRPSDASVYVDGEFRGAAGRLDSLRLPEGRHRIEVVRPGYRTEEREIDVRTGGESDVRIDLGRSGPQ